MKTKRENNNCTPNIFCVDIELAHCNECPCKTCLVSVICNEICNKRCLFYNKLREKFYALFVKTGG